MTLAAKDRLILALFAQLRAERDTREALAAAICTEEIDRSVLVAMLSDPVPAVTEDDIAWSERIMSRLDESATRRRFS
jgi:hypothetical protein